jgi:hypothetical protein
MNFICIEKYSFETHTVVIEDFDVLLINWLEPPLGSDPGHLGHAVFRRVVQFPAAAVESERETGLRSVHVDGGAAAAEGLRVVQSAAAQHPVLLHAQRRVEEFVDQAQILVRGQQEAQAGWRPALQQLQRALHLRVLLQSGASFQLVEQPDSLESVHLLQCDHLRVQLRQDAPGHFAVHCSGNFKQLSHPVQVPVAVPSDELGHHGLQVSILCVQILDFLLVRVLHVLLVVFEKGGLVLVQLGQGVEAHILDVLLHLLPPGKFHFAF